MSKHTPGPWEVECFGEGERAQVSAFDQNGSRHLCARINSNNHEDDAHLIAAAPELLAALKWFINDIDGTHTVMLDVGANVKRSRAAIAKAEGA